MTRHNDGRTISGEHAAQADQGTISAAGFEKYLKGIHFPTNKQQILQTMKNNNATQDVLQMASGLEDKDYASVAEVAKEFSRLKHQ